VVDFSSNFSLFVFHYSLLNGAIAQLGERNTGNSKSRHFSYSILLFNELLLFLDKLFGSQKYLIFQIIPYRWPMQNTLLLSVANAAAFAH